MTSNNFIENKGEGGNHITFSRYFKKDLMRPLMILNFFDLRGHTLFYEQFATSRCKHP